MRRGLFVVLGMVLCIILSMFTSNMRVAAAPELVHSDIDLGFTSPGLETDPAGKLQMGSPVRILSHVSLGGVQTWAKRGVVVDIGGNPQESASISTPTVVFNGTMYKMWYSGTDGIFPNGWILHADSPDGIVWTKRGVVLSPGPPGESASLQFPFVMLEGSTYKMWYTGYDGSKFRIFYATSPDGLVWTRQGLVLNVGPAGSYDDNFVYHPCVFLDGVYKMWYGGDDGSNARMMWATSPDGITWTKQGVALDLGPPGSPEDAAVSSPSIIKVSGGYQMWYRASDGTNDRIFYATSQDAITWTRKGLVLNIGPGGSSDARGVRFQSVLHPTANYYQMWYTGRDGSGIDRIHFANLTSVQLPMSVDVDFYINNTSPGNKIGSDTVQISSLSNATAEISWTPSSLGMMTIIAVIDPLNVIAEIDEVNNIRSIQVEVTTNSPPIADAGPDQTVFRNQPTLLNGTGSFDPDGDQITYHWIQMAGIPLLISGADTWTPLVFPYLSGRFPFRLTVYDPYGASSTSWMNLTVNNRQPVADAGSDILASKRIVVQLDGTGSSDPDGDMLTFTWTQSSGPTVTLFSANTATPTFIPTIAAAYDFDLVIDDWDGGVDADSVRVTVSNVYPVADAGSDSNAWKYTLVTLNGSASSDSDGDVLSYSWAQTSGPSVQLTGSDTAKPSFMPVVAGVYMFSLTVDDGDGGIASDSVYVTVTNRVPTADAGSDRSVAKRTLVLLDGRGSFDDDDDPLSYLWTQTAGPSVQLTGNDTATPSFMPVSAGVYGFSLTIDDGDGGSDSDFVNITVTNSVPIADAGSDRSVAKRTLVLLDGRGSSDDDGDTLSYSWTQTGGPAIVLNAADTPTPSFTPPRSGLYIFNLTVDDGDGGVSYDIVEITVTNSSPTANAGPDVSAQKNTLVTLDASGSSDPDGDPMQLTWTQTGGPTVSLSGADGITATFVPTSTGTYTFELMVDDGDGGNDTDIVQVTAWSLSPIAFIKTNFTTAVLDDVFHFDGGISSDPDGSIVDYAFDFGDGTTVNGTAAARSHTYTDVGYYTVTLTVTDEDGNTSSVSIGVRVKAPPEPSQDLFVWLLMLLIILIVLVVVAIALVLERKKWKKRALEAEAGKKEATEVVEERVEEDEG